MEKRIIGKKSLISAGGLMIYGLGVYLIIQADIGVVPWDVFQIGLSNRLDIIYGNVVAGIGVLIVVADILLGEKIGIGTILDICLVGKTVDLLNWLEIVPKSNNLWISIGMLMIAYYLMGFAQYLYMKQGLGFGPRDALQMALAKRMPKIPVGIVQCMILAVVLIFGWLLDGPIGIGTLIAPLGIGLFQQLNFNIMKFEPKDVEYQSLADSLRVLAGRVDEQA